MVSIWVNFQIDWKYICVVSFQIFWVLYMFSSLLSTKCWPLKYPLTVCGFACLFISVCSVCELFYVYFCLHFPHIFWHPVIKYKNIIMYHWWNDPLIVIKCPYFSLGIVLLSKIFYRKLFGYRSFLLLKGLILRCFLLYCSGASLCLLFTQLVERQ